MFRANSHLCKLLLLLLRAAAVSHVQLDKLITDCRGGQHSEVRKQQRDELQRMCGSARVQLHVNSRWLSQRVGGALAMGGQ